MDRKSIVIMVVCLALLVGMRYVSNWLYPPIPVPATNQVALATNAASYGANASASQSNQPPSLTASTTSPKPLAPSNVPEETLTITNDNARYTFTSFGGGLKLVELLHYPETVSALRKKIAQTNNFATLNTDANLPSLAVLGDERLQGDGVFKLSPIDGGVRAEKALADGLALVKDFKIGTNYLVSANVRLENRSSQAIALPAQEWVVGTATPVGPEDRGLAVGAIWSNGEKTETVNPAWFANKTLGCFPGTPRSEYDGTMTNVTWAAAQNQFFVLAAMPKDPAQELIVRAVDLPRPAGASGATNGPAPQGYQTTMVYPGQTIEPNKSLEREFNLFAGPKEYRTLAKISARFNNNIDWVMGFNGFFGSFAKGLLLAMNWLHSQFTIPYGWLIIVINVIIKVVFWPLTQASTRSMKRMQALQPQIKALQEKYKDEPQKLSQKQLEFWRKNKVNPLGGCLPMLLQIPVFFGFYRMLQSAIELRGAHFLWIGDLSKPDTIFYLPGFDFPVNPMPLIMGVTMLWQSHLQPPSPGMDPAQQKMMRYMPLMMLVFLYNFSSGLALYWTVNNLLTILQT